MALWLRPSGSVLETNDEKSTIEYCEAQGWERQDDSKKQRIRRTKAEIAASLGQADE